MNNVEIQNEKKIIENQKNQINQQNKQLTDEIDDKKN